MSSSNMWLMLALVGTFMTIFMLGGVVDMAMSGGKRRAAAFLGRRRAVSLLESQVTQVSESVNLRQGRLKSSALDRLGVPFAKKILQVVARVTPIDLYRRTNRLII